MTDKSGQKSWGYSNPFNEVGPGGPNSPDMMGDDLYYGGMDEVIKMHAAQTGPIFATANSDEGREATGGPAPGEPNPANMGGRGSKG